LASPAATAGARAKTVVHTAIAWTARRQNLVIIPQFYRADAALQDGGRCKP
jgi:hypothetical protein